MDILFYIKGLLLKREGIVVPGLGSFIIQDTPSRIDRANNKIIPPQKDIKFNSSITHDNDHILAKAIMQEENISLDEAYEKINEQVEKIKQALKGDKKFEIPELGVIEQDENENLHFRINKRDTKTLGLIELDAEPFEQLPGKTRTKSDSGKKPAQKKSTKKKKRPNKFYWIAGIIIVFIGIGVAAFYLDVLDLSEKEILSTKEQGKEQSGQQETSISLPDTAKVAKLNQTIDTITDKKQALMYKENNKEKQKYGQTGNSYHLIVGSFQKRKNAETFSNQVKEKGYNTKIIAKDGLYRISVQSFNNKHQALVSLYHMRDTGKINTVWLLTVSEKDQ